MPGRLAGVQDRRAEGVALEHAPVELPAEGPSRRIVHGPPRHHHRLHPHADELGAQVRGDALLWIGANATERAPVFLPDQIPDDILTTLRRLDLILSVPGGIVAVRAPGDDPEQTLAALTWPIVEALTRLYTPAVIERDSAVRLFLGRTGPGDEIRVRQTGGTRWRAEIGPGVVIRIERGAVEGWRTVAVGEVELPVDRPRSDMSGPA